MTDINSRLELLRKLDAIPEHLRGVIPDYGDGPEADARLNAWLDSAIPTLNAPTDGADDGPADLRSEAERLGFLSRNTSVSDTENES